MKNDEDKIIEALAREWLQHVYAEMQQAKEASHNAE